MSDQHPDVLAARIKELKELTNILRAMAELCALSLSTDEPAIKEGLALLQPFVRAVGPRIERIFDEIASRSRL